MTIRMTVDELYDRFFTFPGRLKEMSLRRVGCRVLADTVKSRHAQRVLDLGSGLTSHILRSLILENPTLEVITTDRDAEWLQVTRNELIANGLFDSGMYEQDEWEKHAATQRPFDVISLDSGNLDYRVDNAALFASWLAPNGAMLLDDFGMRDYAERMTHELQSAGLTVTKLNSTIDEFGFWMAMAERVG